MLGYDKKNGKPITIPYADRYLHTLIVGSDRENKLKNTLIPMINQDLKNYDLGVTIIEPGEDLMKEAIKTCETINRDVITINPLKPNGIIINPLIGEESDVVEIFSSTFKIMNMNLSDTYYLPCDDLLRRAIILIKRLKGDNATLTDIDLLLNNPNNCGRKMITDFIKIEDSNREKAKENERIARWFLNDYYSGMNGERGATNTFELCRALRLQMSTFTNNEYVKNIMLPSEDSSSTILDFNKTLKGKTVVAISIQQQKLGNVGKHMGYLITECFQSAIFRRPGSDATRIPNMVYINQFEQFATPALGNVLTMGRGYRVSLNLVVDSRDCMIPVQKRD